MLDLITDLKFTCTRYQFQPKPNSRSCRPIPVGKKRWNSVNERDMGSETIFRSLMPNRTFNRRVKSHFSSIWKWNRSGGRCDAQQTQLSFNCCGEKKNSEKLGKRRTHIRNVLSANRVLAFTPANERIECRRVNVLCSGWRSPSYSSSSPSSFLPPFDFLSSLYPPGRHLPSIFPLFSYFSESTSIFNYAFQSIAFIGFLLV